MAKKEKIINREYKTLFFDYDGTLFDTTEADKYALRNLGLRRFIPEWCRARKEYLAHIKASKPFGGLAGSVPIHHRQQHSGCHRVRQQSPGVEHVRQGI